MVPSVSEAICNLQSEICHQLLFAAFPRGPGLYYSPVKLLAVVAVYLIWVRTCSWVNRDCQEVGLPAPRWASLLLLSGLAGLVLVWALPVFWAAFVALVALYLAPTLIYVSIRNDKVDEADRVLTPNHLRNTLAQALGGRKQGPAGEKKVIPVRFISKGSSGQDDDAVRVRRAQESEGYREAIELVHDAVCKRATDIHMEPTHTEMVVRYRIDGILHIGRKLDRDVGDKVLNVFKVLAAMDITEKRKAQDGSFSAEIQAPVDQIGRTKKPPSRSPSDEDDDEPFKTADEEPKLVNRLFDFRVATAGSVAGEKIVMRLLDRSRQVTDLSQLGMRGKLRDQIRGLVGQPHGLFLVCGPTGSGKSTTLCACLFQIDRSQKNVITVEDPVEYHIDGVTQIEINPRAGKTFASELRSILRQDPDVIYLGEVRDQETAEIACQAAQTGHMVLSTIHANEAIGSITRLMERGLKPFMIASSLTAVLSQRLVRTLCPKCKVAYRPNPELLRRANLPADKIKVFYRPPKPEDRGEEGECEFCGGTGYRGRTGIFELLVINERIRDLIKDNPDIDALRAEAVRNGMTYLIQDGMRVVIEGDTSIDEIQRVAK